MTPQEILDELQNLDQNNIGAWPTFVYVGICVLLIILCIVGGWYQVVQPKNVDLERYAREEQTLLDEFRKKQRKAANLDALKAQLEEMERSFGSMLRQLPSKSEVANLLNDISQTRVAAGLEEQLFEPKGEQRKDFYAVLPNKIIVFGDYHQLADFVSRVSALPRIVTISNVSINREDKNSRSGRLRMEATVNTYRYLDSEE